MKKTLTLIAAAFALFPLAACAAETDSDAMSASPTAMSSDKMSQDSMEKDDASTSPSAMSSDDAMSSEDSMSDDAMAMHGALVTQAEYEADPSAYANTTIVYLFSADWCPTCQATAKALEDGSVTVPAKVTLVDVDYDKATELKKTYGVTMQHTLVQVDGSGNLVAKWSPASASALFSGLKG